jgi:hypothetical protein
MLPAQQSHPAHLQERGHKSLELTWWLSQDKGSKRTNELVGRNEIPSVGGEPCAKVEEKRGRLSLPIVRLIQTAPFHEF